MFKNRLFCPVPSANLKRSSATRCPSSERSGRNRRRFCQTLADSASNLESCLDRVIRSSRQSEGPGQGIVTRMTKVHVLRNNLVQIGIFTLLHLVNWCHHHISRGVNTYSGSRSCQRSTDIENFGGFQENVSQSLTQGVLAHSVAQDG